MLSPEEKPRFKVQVPKKGQMGTYGGEAWMSLCANCFGEDVYVVDRRELLDLAEGHVTRCLEKENPFFQKVPRRRRKCAYCIVERARKRVREAKD